MMMKVKGNRSYLSKDDELWFVVVDIFVPASAEKVPVSLAGVALRILRLSSIFTSPFVPPHVSAHHTKSRGLVAQKDP